MRSLLQIADRHGLLIIEDAAQALGSRFQGRCAGTFGLAGTISFYPAKTLGSLGDGGAILTNNTDMHEKISCFRDHGRGADGEVHGWGWNSRLDNVQAAILDIKLQDYANDVSRRREIAGLYQSQLEHVEELLLPPAPDSDPDHYDVYQNYEIEAEDRDELQAYLRKNAVGTLVQWGGKTVHQITSLGLQADLPYTESMIARSLMLPMNTSLSDDDVEYVCHKITDYYAAKNRRSTIRAA
jgi:dTDP-4-amino-4,6-dideoxygalactose transaminase